jgi:site-specific DNA-methyltransferase (adenine-specific)
VSLKPYYEEPGIILYHGDCREVMAQLEPESIDTIITDPPYGLEFMGKDWDKAVPGPEFWRQALRVCKPGAMMMAFGGTRLYHRLTCAIEDAGWEVRDCLMWLYGSGFPKSHDISKAIDKAAGAERKVVGKRTDGRYASKGTDLTKGRFVEGSIPGGYENGLIHAPATPEAEQWDGWGTALKPAWEPIVLAMKPLDGTFAQNALKHGVAGLNIDGGRIGTDERENLSASSNEIYGQFKGKEDQGRIATGRWPANLMLDEDTAAALDEQSGELTSGANPERRGSDKFRECYGDFAGQMSCAPIRGADSGRASRFFYIAKPSATERGHRPDKDLPLFGTVDKGFRNTHPTVKPTPLMHRLIALVSYLARLTATPSGGVVLDPFGGSGTTAVAVREAGRRFVGIEIEKKYLDITIQRLRQTP